MSVSETGWNGVDWIRLAQNGSLTAKLNANFSLKVLRQEITLKFIL
jgi:hypothetical protein